MASLVAAPRKKPDSQDKKHGAGHVEEASQIYPQTAADEKYGEEGSEGNAQESPYKINDTGAAQRGRRQEEYGFHPLSGYHEERESQQTDG